MSLDTYTGLKQSIIDHLDRDDLTQYVDDFIAIAEARHKREIRIREMLSRSNIAITDGDRYLDLPSDFLEMKFFRILNPNTSDQRRYLYDLKQLSEVELTDKSTNFDQPPKFFAIHSQLEFDSEIDQDYTGEIFYYQELTALSDTNETNTLLDRAPDIYLYASLMASAPFLLNDERVQVWGSLYGDARDTLLLSQRLQTYSGPQVARASGV